MRLHELILLLALGLAPQLDAQTTTAQASAYSNVEFAWRLHRELALTGPNDNLVWSPLSMQSVLAVLGEGARGRTAEELGMCLGLPASARRPGDAARPWDFTSIHQANRLATSALCAPWSPPDQEQSERMLKQTPDKLTRREYGKIQEMTTVGGDRLGPYRPFVFRSVNRLWVQRGLPLEAECLATIRGNYGQGIVEGVDFVGNRMAERLRVNGWIERETEGLLKDFIGQDEWSHQTRLVATNVVYLRADWSVRFDPASTVRERFYALGQSAAIGVPMMQNKMWARYAAFNRDGTPFATPEEVPLDANDADPAFYPNKGGYHLVEMTYAGQRASMVLVQPTRFARLVDLEATLTTAQLRDMLNAGKQRQCFVKLPRFKTRTTSSLLDPMARLGLAALAKARDADFTGLCAPQEARDRLYLEALRQTADIEVNERGTVAAAASSGSLMGLGGAPATRRFVPQFIANQAFLYFIKDEETDQILFMGRLMNPAK